MKVLVVLVVLIIANLQSGQATVTVKIKAYNASGKVNIMTNNEIRKVTFTLGTRVLLTCNVTGLPGGSEVLSYRWHHKRSGCPNNWCEIRDEDPYYRVVSNTLLVDVTSENNVGLYRCQINYTNMQGVSVSAEELTPEIALAGTTSAFLYTPTSLLLGHDLITDVQQVTGTDSQQWIKCTNGRDRGEALIHGNVPMARTYTSVDRTATLLIMPRLPRNGQYYCKADSKRYNFNLFLRNQSKDNIPTLTYTVIDRDTWQWTIATPDGSQVERYIVQFECRVRNMTFVEKYMSVSASGGTGRVATSVSCFRRLGQLYRVKVWAVSGPNISTALACTTDGQCKEKVDGPTPTPQVITSTPTTAGSTVTPSRVTTTTRSNTPSTTPGGQAEIGTFIGVGVGIGILLSVVLALVGVIVVAVMVKRRAANKQMKSIKMKKNPSYYNPVAVEMAVKGLGYDYEDADKDKSNDKDTANASVVEGFDPYEDVDSKAQMKNTKKPAPKESFTPASATNVGELYAVVDKSKKKGTKKKQEENGCTDTNEDDLYTMPMKKKSNMTDEEKVVSGGAVKSEEYDDVEGLKYEPKVDSQPQQSSEGDSKAPNADMLYAVVDKSHKKKK